MPNHITNVLTIECESQERHQEVILSILNCYGEFDFSRVIPMPEMLRNTDSPNTVNSRECIEATGYSCWYSWATANWGTKWNAYSNEYFYDRLGFKRWHRVRKARLFGGMKERGYPSRINKKRFKAFNKIHGSQKEVIFDTAWATPEQVFFSLSRRFPDVKVIINFADEDTGSNCGTFSIVNGDAVSVNIAPDWSKQTTEEKRKWCEFAFKITHKHDNPAEYGYTPEWDYSEELADQY